MTTSSRVFVAPVLLALVLTVGAGAAHAKKKRERKPRRTGVEVCATFAPGPAQLLLGAGVVGEPSKYAPMCVFRRRLPDADAREEAYKNAMLASMTARMTAMREKRKFVAPKPPHLEDTISITHQGDKDSAAVAAAAMKNAREAMQKGITSTATGSLKGGFRSKVKIGDGPETSTKETEAVTKEISDDATRITENIEAKAGGQALAGADKERTVSMTFQSEVELVTAAGLDEAHYAKKYRNLTARKGKRVIVVAVDIDGKSDEERKELAVALAQEWLKK